MKSIISNAAVVVFTLLSFQLMAQPKAVEKSSQYKAEKKLFLEVHQLAGGKIKYEDAEKAHARDIVVANNFGVEFMKYWVNEDEGMIFSLATAPDKKSLEMTHNASHGYFPEHIYEVASGAENVMKQTKNLYMDVHYLGAGNVTKEAVAGAHQKDLAIQDKYKADFMSYWVDEKAGTVMCLVQAKDSTTLVAAHKEAHGLIPSRVVSVKQGK